MTETYVSWARNVQRVHNMIDVRQCWKFSVLLAFIIYSLTQIFRRRRYVLKLCAKASCASLCKIILGKNILFEYHFPRILKSVHSSMRKLSLDFLYALIVKDITLRRFDVPQLPYPDLIIFPDTDRGHGLGLSPRYQIVLRIFLHADVRDEKYYACRQDSSLTYTMATRTARTCTHTRDAINRYSSNAVIERVGELHAP